MANPYTITVCEKIRDLTLFNLAIDNKLRRYGLVKICVMEVAQGKHIVFRATVIRQKTGQPVREVAF